MRILISLAVLFLVSCAARVTPPMAPAHSRADLVQHRALQLERLHAYRDRGVFPTDEATGRPLSIFRDAQGRLCPMASLIDQSGHRELVDYVVATNNALRLADVHDGPIYDWMLSSGLTQEEIILIQGAMTIDEMNQMESVYTLDYVRNEVGRVLDGILATLERQTADSLHVAATRLAAPRVAGN